VFDPLMEHWVGSYLYHNRSSFSEFHKILVIGEIVLSTKSSQVYDVIMLYSTSTLDKATTLCFLIFQEKNSLKRKNNI